MIRVDYYVSDVLSEVVRSLDIPDHIYEEATLRYEDVGEYLADNASPLAQDNPRIYPQGSFRLGTAIKPLQNDEYDIDLVCLLDLEKENVTQKELKNKVGARLKSRDDLLLALEEKRRCWRIKYQTGVGKPSFHLDILPSIPNIDTMPTGILLTDKELVRWQRSNPIAYAEWFQSRMQLAFARAKAHLAKSLNEDVEDVPDWKVKTTLQQSIQILKRHRDLHFRDSLDLKPVSIIITTLSARAYNGQADLLSALIDIVNSMEHFIEYSNGKWLVTNPVDDGENFADKWNEDARYREQFVRWMGRVRSDFGNLLKPMMPEQFLGEIERFLGPDSVVLSSQRLGIPARATGSRFSAPQVPVIGSISHVETPSWPVTSSCTVKIAASVYKKPKGKSLFPLTDVPVPKGIWIRFIAKTDAAQPYEIRWQVVNTGLEALEAQQPRGDFYESDELGGRHRWETTAYRGTHWVEAFVIKDGICIARSGRRYVRVR